MSVSPPILVLVNPQDIVNIASAVRIAKNFGIDRMRLVNPEVFDPYRIEGIAHNTADLVARIEIRRLARGRPWPGLRLYRGADRARARCQAAGAAAQ